MAALPTIHTCSHPGKYVIEDLHDGTIVCTLCALVLDQVYSYNHFLIDAHGFSTVHDNMVTNICDNCNFGDVIRANAQVIYESASNKLKDDARRFAMEEISSYAVYKSLKENGVPISGKELLSISNVSLSKIWEIENVCEPNSYLDADTEIAHFVERYCAYCQLSLSDVQEIKSNIVEATSICMNYMPQNIAVGLIYMYRKTFSVQSIAKICNVSPSSIYKIVKVLNEQMK